MLVNLAKNKNIWAVVYWVSASLCLSFFICKLTAVYWIINLCCPVDISSGRLFLPPRCVSSRKEELPIGKVCQIRDMGKECTRKRSGQMCLCWLVLEIQMEIHENKANGGSRNMQKGANQTRREDKFHSGRKLQRKSLFALSSFSGFCLSQIHIWAKPAGHSGIAPTGVWVRHSKGFCPGGLVTCFCNATLPGVKVEKIISLILCKPLF